MHVLGRKRKYRRFTKPQRKKRYESLGSGRRAKSTVLARKGVDSISRIMELGAEGTPASLSHALLLGIKDFEIGLLRSVSEGLPFSSYSHLKKNLGLPAETLLQVLHIPRRTLLRRKVEGRFTSAESERLVRLSRIFAQAIMLFEGDRTVALDWLRTPRAVLDNASPLSLIETEVGGREVEALIERLEHGVFS